MDQALKLKPKAWSATAKPEDTTVPRTLPLRTQRWIKSSTRVEELGLLHRRYHLREGYNISRDSSSLIRLEQRDRDRVCRSTRRRQ